MTSYSAQRNCHYSLAHFLSVVRS